MEKKIVVLLAEGFEEVEALAVVDAARRAGVKCLMVSLGNKDVVGTHGISVCADETFDEVAWDDVNMIVLPGGLPGADNLRDDVRVISLVKDFMEKNKFVSAICAAPQVLAAADVVRGRHVTSYPAETYRLALEKAGAEYIEEDVVVDKNLITSRGPATALAFSYQILEVIGVDSSGLRAGMLYER